MSLGERLWDGFRAVIRMEDRIDALTDTVKSQQAKIEDLIGRIIRLETAFAMLHQQPLSGQASRLPHKD